MYRKSDCAGLISIDMADRPWKCFYITYLSLPTPVEFIYSDQIRDSRISQAFDSGR